MAQFFTPFSDAPTITERWVVANGTVTIETSGLPSGSGSHALKMVLGSTGDRYAASWDEPGTPSDTDILVKWLLPTGSGSLANPFRIILRGGGSAGAEDGYYLTFTPASGGIMSLAKYLAGTVSAISGANQNISAFWTVDAFMWTRLQVTGTTVRHRTWLHGTSEPGTWGGSGTDASLSSGWVGIGGTANSTTAWIAQIGVGTGGDPAPDAPLAETGASSASVTFATSASGLRTPAVGASSASVSFATSAAGLRTPAVGASSASVTFATSAAGEDFIAPPETGESAASVTFATSASGLRTPAVAASSASVDFDTAAAGLRTPAVGASSASVTFSTSANGTVFTPPIPDYVIPITPRGVVALAAAGRGTVTLVAQSGNTLTIPASAAGVRTLAAAPRGTVTLEVPA